MPAGRELPHAHLTRPPPADVGRGGPCLCRQHRRRKVHRAGRWWCSPASPRRARAEAHGLHRLLGVHTRLEEALHKLGRLGALLTGPRAGAHAVAQGGGRRIPSSRRNQTPMSPADGLSLAGRPPPGRRWPGRARPGQRRRRPCSSRSSRRGVPMTSDSSRQAARVFSSSVAGTSTRRGPSLVIIDHPRRRGSCF